MAAVVHGQAVVAHDTVIGDVIVCMLNITVSEGAFVSFGIFILEILAALMCCADTDHILFIAAADVSHPTSRAVC